MTIINTSDLSGLPSPENLRRLFQSLAMLDAVMSPEWEYRYYSYDAHWSDNETMGSMRNGCGDDLFVLFTNHGCFLKGFAHELRQGNRSPKEFYESIPDELLPATSEPAFKTDDVTFCCWRLNSDGNWRQAGVPLPDGNDPDGSLFILSRLDGNPETYRKFAEDYYEMPVPHAPVAAIYKHELLTQDIVAALNHETELSDLKEDISEIGYPA
ncbi:MAG: hypothetical protein IMF08_06095 [Proteobacteria bacterium]|nr:hypothetical protein [Pseudomonadota bacterium]